MKRYSAILSPSFHQMNLKSSSSPLLQQVIPDGYRPTCFNGKKYRQQYRNFHTKNENRDGARYLIGLGCFVLLFQGGMYYYHYDNIENTEIIQERNLTDGKLCKIYGKLDSNKVLKLNETYIGFSHEPVLIYECSKEGKLFFKSSRTRDTLRCYCDDLEVKFSHGKSGVDNWFDNRSELTDTLKIDLGTCKIYTDPTREYSEALDVYNSHLEEMEKLNSRDSKTKMQHVVELIPFFKKSIIQRVLDKGNQVILIGRVDAKCGVFKCEQLISPSERAAYSQLNGETMKMAVLAAAFFVVASWI